MMTERAATASAIAAVVLAAAVLGSHVARLGRREEGSEASAKAWFEVASDGYQLGPG